MKGKYQHFNVDYRVRSFARVDNLESGNSFAVLCYGYIHGSPEDQINMSGGDQLARKLERRGVDTEKWRCNVFKTSAIKNDFKG